MSELDELPHFSDVPTELPIESYLDLLSEQKAIQREKVWI